MSPFEPKRRAPDPSVTHLRERIREQLTTAETIIVELRREIDRLRRDNLALAAEREQIRGQLARQDAARLEEVEAHRTARLREQQRIDELRADLEARNEALAGRCAELEQALTRERATTAAARDEIACLEDQVAELQSTVDLLVAKIS